MAAIRENILNSRSARDNYIRGVLLLDQERPGITSRDLLNFVRQNLPNLRISGIVQELSTYDIFVFWHVFAMSAHMESGNAAHGNSLFLPWHRMYLLRFEQHLQRVLNDNDFALPYWDWAMDGELGNVTQQRQSSLWDEDNMGRSRGSVDSGALADMQVRLAGIGIDRIESISPRPLERSAGTGRVRRLPNKSRVGDAFAESEYDVAPWSSSSTSGHRNTLEGWIRPPSLHNRVHVWVGGDMAPGTSPNDPVFFLNHGNVDRIWEAWMEQHGREYRPKNNEGIEGQRIDSTMLAIIGDALTPAETLNPSQWYSYDSLMVN